MKFGKALKEELPCEWRGHAVNYKLLKRLLKRCVGLAVHQKLDANTFVHRPSTPLRPPSMSTRDALSSSRAEMTFFWAMRGQLFKVNRLFVFQQYELVRRMGDFDDGLERFLWSSPLPSQAFVRYAIESVLLPRLEKLYLQMKVLEKFCDLNFQAVAKILKKHDKWTGFTTRADYEAFMVDHEPFAAHLPLSMAIGYLEETSFWLTRIIASTPPSSSSFTWPHPSSSAEASRAEEDKRVESLTSRHGWNSPTNASTTVLKNFEEEEEGDEVAYRLPPLHFVLSPRRLQLLAVAASGLKRQCSRDSDGPPPKRRRG